jgi:hypothetical protein
VEGRTPLEVFLGWSDHLEGDDLETPLFKARDDGPDKVALDAIRLDHDIGALVVGHGRRCTRGTDLRDKTGEECCQYESDRAGGYARRV